MLCVDQRSKTDLGFSVIFPARFLTTGILRGSDDDEIFLLELFENCLPT